MYSMGDREIQSNIRYKTLTQLSFRDPVPLPLRPDLLSQVADLHPCPPFTETDGLVLERESS